MSDTCIKTRIPIYGGLMASLRKGIVAKGLQGGDFLATEQDLCRESGLSRVSVRRATEQLIREGIVERRPGKGLFVRQKDRQTRVVQVVVPDMSFEQCVQIARGVQNIGTQNGYQLQVYDAHNQMDRDIAVLKQLPEQDIQGAVILSWHHPRFTEVVFELKQRRFPFVLVDEHSSDPDIHSVTADNTAGGYLAGEAIVKAGHRRIGFVGNVATQTVRARLEGMRDAIGDHGLPFDRSLVMDLNVQPQENWSQRIADCTRQLLSRPDRPTAIFFSNDQVAADGYQTARAMGLRIPQDLSIVGFDNSPICRWLAPTLASIRQPSMEMGQAAMNLLLKQWNGPAAKAAQLTLPVKWVPGDSIAPPAR